MRKSHRQFLGEENLIKCEDIHKTAKKGEKVTKRTAYTTPKRLKSNKKDSCKRWV